MSVKKLQHNRGFTLVELVVAMTIMAFIIIAVSGIMFSNNLIFRKTKSDITVQNSAQDVYNKMNEDIMQAKHIYIKGYTVDSAGDLTFAKCEVGASVAETVTEQTYLLPTDKYVLTKKTGSTKDFLSGNFDRDTTSRDQMLDAMTDAEKAFYTDLLNTPEDQINAKLQTCTQDQRDTYVKLVYYTDSEVNAMREAMNADDRKAFDSYWNRFKYMNQAQINEATAFLDSVPSPAATKSFSTLSTKAAGSTPTYSKLYITELIVVYSQDVDTSNCTTADVNRFNADKTSYSTGVKEVESADADGNITKSVVSDNLDYTPKDTVTVKYTFGEAGDENKIKVEYTYKYMTKLNTSNFTGVDNNVVTDKLNYVVCDDKVVPGCEAEIDAANDSIKLFLYFSENGMSYTDKGMVKLRNSYVLHDAK